ncbi:hypothetical protein ACFWBB_23470 [Streptomyces sp. NPDC060000]|uniref:hypothetical protein n=1 Tax=Streptomyces sp. NPDC060000 TaxID=3347031 RepID=UPI00369AD317
MNSTTSSCVSATASGAPTCDAAMRDNVRALFGPVGCKNGWQLAEHAGHRTPDGLQRLLNAATWNADDVRDDLRTYVADQRADGSHCRDE